jgi:hypothetical protein
MRAEGKNPEHRPKSHQAHLEWMPLRMVNWARSIGPHTARVFERILEDATPAAMASLSSSASAFSA